MLQIYDVDKRQDKKLKKQLRNKEYCIKHNVKIVKRQGKKQSKFKFKH